MNCKMTFQRLWITYIFLVTENENSSRVRSRPFFLYESRRIDPSSALCREGGKWEDLYSLSVAMLAKTAATAAMMGGKSCHLNADDLRILTQ